MAFASPLVLWALVLLPGLWWLLRLTPPAPKRVTFPALRLLLGLTAKEETPARTPWWLLVLRLALCALLIIGLARPLLHPDATSAAGTAPLLLVVDTGWAAGRDWPERQQALDRLVTQAERQDRPVLLLATAAGAGGEAPQVQGPMNATAARRLVQALAPQPWPTDRAAALGALDIAQKSGPLAGSAADSYWLADGLNDGSVATLAGRLRALGRVTVMTAGADHGPLLLRTPNSNASGSDGGTLMVPVERAEGAQAQPIAVEALGEDGRALGRADGIFAPGQRQLTLPLTLPGELRNAAVRLHLEDRAGVGASLLLDDRWRRRPVGLATAGPGGDNQPLLSSLYYLDRALAPYAEVRRGTISALLDGGVSILVLPDSGALSDSDTSRLARWIDQGGVLVRFGGTRLAHESEPIGAETLLPVRLRGGDRSLGGALSWTTPAHLAPFDDKSPFAGLAVPPDVTVSRQVLAEPGPDMGDKVWARLEDGTPLVTGERRGKGWLALVHTSADPAWSNLALSGLYVDMLRRLVALSDGLPGGIGGNAGGALPPLSLLDGQGRLVAPSAVAQPLEPEGKDEAAGTPVGPLHPPGYYGVGDRRRALNLAGSVAPLVPMEPLAGVAYQGFGGTRETDLRPWFLGLAAALWVADLLLSLLVRGLLPTSLRPKARWRRGAAAAALALATVLAAPRGHAATPDDEIVKATTANWLAYVETGDRAADATTKAGLLGLGEQLNRRTAVEVAGAMSVNVEKDDLALFPLLYWVVTPGQAAPSDAAVAKLNQYLHAGGMILFDTRDQGAPDAGIQARLRDLTHGLDIPPLAPVGPEHVLGRTFFLMQDFPGRQAGGQVWAEASEGRVNDGVSPVLVGGNDWAGAWAIDGQGRPLNAVVPGGERQREMAYRFGINLVMYALTGNYKADQVHVPAILERLGQ
ncbi:DUF4159 domain-containing protein [Nitrospirillum viridazoti]|uniref:LytTR family transcriptional regulator n=1 Tax=Nitrospirillum viridazoti CBAmc TaxID=1441467 RepID=A0A248JR12_9PROT|nr:DUF4159 domain-containing protein [Nitrospirillum amazonense]ASG21172.1 hypothetical protein Y958_10310 [Nitrospirillum amazonense CBAmc]TWB32164.1 putative membrane protein (TIGR02226 family) [Nitrospirillum amazonense]